ncbi:MAG: SDR family NAD(P)-dependent oxidoreductase [Desulfobacterales bacterium]
MNTTRAIVVTGASRGLGAAAARWLGHAGCGVVLFSRNREALFQVAASVEDLGGTPIVVPGNVSDPDACRQAVSAALDRFGRLDGLINNAGTLDPISVLSDSDPSAWRTNIDINLMGPYFMMRHAIPFLRETRGRIVNISSGAASKAVRGWSAYCAAKAALTHLGAVVSVEEPSITAISLRPGVVDTDMQAEIRSRGGGVMDPENVAYFEALKTEGRLEPPWVPARSAAWLVLDAPRDWSGRFVDYDDPQVKGPAGEWLGPGPV